jgi:hypothetical protein
MREFIRRPSIRMSRHVRPAYVGRPLIRKRSPSIATVVFRPAARAGMPARTAAGSALRTVRRFIDRDAD